MNAKQELQEALFFQSENKISHANYNRELEFYSAVKRGDINSVKKLLSPLADGNSFGVLSDKPVNNVRYHFIIAVALITRFCMEGGLPAETAYTLSDIYIRKADKSNNTDSIRQLHKEMVLEFTESMREIVIRDKSTAITRAIDYIHKNIFTPFTQSDVASHCKISTAYLSHIFKKETGSSMTDYIHKVKIEEAKDMLKFSKKEYTEISEELCFSTHSHFISIFKKITGITPKSYREKYSNSNWK